MRNGRGDCRHLLRRWACCVGKGTARSRPPSIPRNPQTSSAQESPSRREAVLFHNRPMQVTTAPCSTSQKPVLALPDEALLHWRSSGGSSIVHIFRRTCSA